MFIRSKDGTHITEIHEVQQKEKELYVNGALFESYESEEEAAQAMRLISEEMSDFETFLDLSGEFIDDLDDDDDDFWDDDDDEMDDDDDNDDGEIGFGDHTVIFRDKDGNPFLPFT